MQRGERLNTKTKRKSEFENFDRLVTELLKVPHSTARDIQFDFSRYAAFSAEDRVNTQFVHFVGEHNEVGGF
jgi:hypothetical protein